MINGVLQIVAAVLFAVLYMFEDLNVVWLYVAGAYLLVGIINLIISGIKSHRRQKIKQTESAASDTIS